MFKCIQTHGRLFKRENTVKKFLPSDFKYNQLGCLSNFNLKLNRIKFCLTYTKKLKIAKLILMS